MKELTDKIPYEETNPFILRDLGLCYKLLGIKLVSFDIFLVLLQLLIHMFYFCPNITGKNKEAIQNYEEAIKQDNEDLSEAQIDEIQKEIKLLSTTTATTTADESSNQ